MTENPAERDGDIASGQGHSAEPTHITDSKAAPMIQRQQADQAVENDLGRPGVEAAPDEQRPAVEPGSALDAPTSAWGPYAAEADAGVALDANQALGTSGGDASGGSGGSSW